MKVPIECPIFRAYLQKEIPAAFDSDGLMSTHHEVVKNIRRIKIVLLGASSLDGIEYLGKLRWLYIDNNPEIKHLPKLPNTLDTFYSNHKFETSVQPVFFYNMWNFIMLDSGCVIYGSGRWGSLDEFKAWIAEFGVERKFAPFITECEQYLSKLNNQNMEHLPSASLLGCALKKEQPKPQRRYMLFAGNIHNPKLGVDDLQGVYFSLEAAKGIVREMYTELYNKGEEEHFFANLYDLKEMRKIPQSEITDWFVPIKNDEV